MAGTGKAHLRAPGQSLLRGEDLVVEFPAGRGQKVHAVTDVNLDVMAGETCADLLEFAGIVTGEHHAFAGHQFSPAHGLRVPAAAIASRWMSINRATPSPASACIACN